MIIYVINNINVSEIIICLLTLNANNIKSMRDEWFMAVDISNS